MWKTATDAENALKNFCKPRIFENAFRLAKHDRVSPILWHEEETDDGKCREPPQASMRAVWPVCVCSGWRAVSTYIPTVLCGDISLICDPLTGELHGELLDETLTAPRQLFLILRPRPLSYLVMLVGSYSVVSV